MNDIIELQLINYGSIDLNNTNIPLIFTIDDISNFGSRKSSFSKTIEVPGTKKNNRIFESIFEIKRNGQFNMTTKHSCRLMVNKNTILSGFLKLNSIEKIQNNGRDYIKYKVNIYDEVKDLFTILGEKKLNELDFSSGFTFQGSTYRKGNHIYSIPEIRKIIESGETYENVYDYSIINYSYNLNGGNFPFNSISLFQLYPCIYHKAIIDRIFYECNYNYSSEYFNGDTYDGIFKKVVNIYNGGKIFTNMNLCQYWSSGKTITSTREWIEFIEDYSSTYNSTEYKSYYIDDYFYNNSGETSYSKGVKVKTDGDYIIKLWIDVALDEGGQSVEEPGGDIHEGVESQYQLWKQINDGTYEKIKTYTTFEISGSELLVTFNNIMVDEYELEANDKLFVQVQPGRKGFLSVDVEINTIGIEIIKKVDDENFINYSGQTLSLSSFLPDMTCADFLKNHIKLSNLYIWKDKEDPNENKIYIEPRDDFYDVNKEGVNVINWTNKIDWSKKITIEDLSGDLNKELIFSYTEGDDYYSKLYVDRNNDIYGTKSIEIDNNILTDSNEIMVDWQSIQFYSNNNGNIPIKVSEKDDDIDGISSSSPLLGLIEYKTYVSDFWNLGGGGVNDDNGNLNKVKFSPHSINWAGRKYDYNFETNNSLTSSLSLFNDNNSYKLFWENYVNNITDINQRRVTYYVKLTYKDILNLNFRNTIIIDGQEYLLERIEFDPTNKESSKVKLVKKKVIE